MSGFVIREKKVGAGQPTWYVASFRGSRVDRVTNAQRFAKRFEHEEDAKQWLPVIGIRKYLVEAIHPLPDKYIPMAQSLRTKYRMYKNSGENGEGFTREEATFTRGMGEGVFQAAEEISKQLAKIDPAFDAHTFMDLFTAI